MADIFVGCGDYNCLMLNSYEKRVECKRPKQPRKFYFLWLDLMYRWKY